eukprot:gene26996-biopygen22648
MKVTNMSGMFMNASMFNQPIGQWEIYDVAFMSSMFSVSFNQPIGQWQVHRVKSMSGMFFAAKSFNQSLGDWDIGSVQSMSLMFADTVAFNQPVHALWQGYMLRALMTRDMFEGARGMKIIPALHVF